LREGGGGGAYFKYDGGENKMTRTSTVEQQSGTGRIMFRKKWYAQNNNQDGGWLVREVLVLMLETNYTMDTMRAKLDHLQTATIAMAYGNKVQAAGLDEESGEGR